MNMGIKLKNRRKELDLTMLDVAKKVGVSEATVSRWESGDIANMRRDKIALLAKALQVSPSFIMGWDAIDDNPTSNGLDKQLDGVDFALWGEVHDLTDEEKQDIINFVKFTKSKRNN